MFRRQKKIIFKIIPLLILTILFFLFLGLKPLAVREVIVNTEYDLNTNKGILDFLGKLKGENILLIKEKEIEKKILNSDLRIKKVEVKKEILGKIIIGITVRRPLAAAVKDKGFLLIDNDGLVLGFETQNFNLPILNLGLQNLGPGSRIEDEGKKLLEILELILKFEKVTEISQDQEGIKIRLVSGTNVILPKNDNQEKINALQMILSRFRIEGKSPEKIDMRFEKPVVSF